MKNPGKYRGFFLLDKDGQDGGIRRCKNIANFSLKSGMFKVGVVLQRREYESF
jgi:hypothetical protein